MCLYVYCLFWHFFGTRRAWCKRADKCSDVFIDRVNGLGKINSFKSDPEFFRNNLFICQHTKLDFLLQTHCTGGYSYSECSVLMKASLLMYWPPWRLQVIWITLPHTGQELQHSWLPSLQNNKQRHWDAVNSSSASSRWCKMSPFVCLCCVLLSLSISHAQTNCKSGMAYRFTDISVKPIYRHFLKYWLLSHVRLQCNPSAAKYALRCTSKHTSMHFKGYFNMKYIVLLLKYFIFASTLFSR